MDYSDELYISLCGEINSEYWRQLIEYVALIRRWSRRLNLVSMRDREQLLDSHILPSLKWLPIISALPHRTLLDVGSGAGFPAIPLKIFLPETVFYLVESRRRRANFLREVSRSLGLERIVVVHSRMQDWGGVPGGFDIITSRAMMAFSGLHIMVSPFLAPHGVLLANILARIDERSAPALIWIRRLRGDLRERSFGIFLGKVDNR